MRRALRWELHIGDFLIFAAHDESLLPVNYPHHTVGIHASRQLEPNVHDYLDDHIEHMDVDADNDDFQNGPALSDCQNKIYYYHVGNSAHLWTAIAD